MPAQQSLPTAPPRPGTPHSAFPLRGVICSASSLQTRSCTPCDGRRPAVLTDGDEGHEAPHARARVGAASLFSGCALWSAGRGWFLSSGHCGYCGCRECVCTGICSSAGFRFLGVRGRDGVAGSRGPFCAAATLFSTPLHTPVPSSPPTLALFFLF
uniref:Uncharacterized protein n=1 Tax=Rousettus aegyptiacus TaxID=9407 RepID=A0A7J8CIU7_ROUAE|nr:hypothetical protein HJG63_009232 [Rousettus aegyptiacus]